MRIVAGKYKGRKFHPPKKLDLRPTTDFAKEGLFNVLRNRMDMEGIRVLDLFTGTGNMSFEFSSRGAEQVVSVDQNRSCTTYIKKISRELDIKGILVHNADAIQYLKRDNRPGEFDLIFADPPYAFQDGLKLIKLVFAGNHLKSGGFFIFEHGGDQNFEDHPLYQMQKKFGNVNFTFFAKGS